MANKRFTLDKRTLDFLINFIDPYKLSRELDTMITQEEGREITAAAMILKTYLAQEANDGRAPEYDLQKTVRFVGDKFHDKIELPEAYGYCERRDSVRMTKEQWQHHQKQRENK